MMEYSIELDPLTKTRIKMKLFDNVTNTAELRKKIMSGKLQCCILKPSLIFDPFQVAVAANKAAISKKTTTKSVFTEILFNLSPSTNISQSLQKFGIDDKDKSLLVAVLENVEEDSRSGQIFEQVEGDVLEISEISCLSDVKAIRKLYKISDEEYKNVNLLNSIVTRIACKE